jgi:hypothetical protein
VNDYSFVNRKIGLEVLETLDGAIDIAHDPARHRESEMPRIADRVQLLTGRGGIGEHRSGTLLRWNPDEGDIKGAVEVDQSSVELSAVVEGHPRGVHVLNHMEVREHEALLRIDERSSTVVT